MPVKTRLIEIVRNRLPAAVDSLDDETAAFRLQMAADRLVRDFDEAFDPDRELQRLDEVERAARALRAAIDRLHPTVFDSWLEEGMPNAPNDALEAISELEIWLSTARLVAAIGTLRGRRSDLNVRGASIAAETRWLWSRRTGKVAPSTVNPASPFGVFTQEILEVLEAGDARSALATLAKIHRSPEENR